MKTRFFPLVCLLCGVTAVCAQEAGSRRPSSEEMVRRLAPAPADEGQPLTRGLGATRSLGATRNLAVSKGVAAEGGRVDPVAPPPSIDLDINFEYNSAVLTPDARIVLDNLGRALGDPALQASRFEVAGHTDGAGSDVYNQNLSERRAKAVAEYLGREHAVAATRLQVVGYGKSRLLDAANPQNALNRRVQVVNLGQGAAK